MNPLAYVEAAGATLVALWLAAGLLANPLLFGAVALLVLLPLALVVLPLLGVRAFGDRSVTVRRPPCVRRVAESVSYPPARDAPSDD